jgi:hypothetical protein
MNEFEDELRGRLAARVGEVSVGEDWDDLVNRMVRSGRRTTRALALALVLSLCGAAVAIVSSARHPGDDPTRKTASKNVAAVAADRVVETHAAVPTISLSSGQSFGAVPNFAGSPAGTKVAFPQGSLSPMYNNDVRLLPARGGVNVAPYDSMPMARVFTRTTPAGVTIRAYRTDVTSASSVQGPPWWTPPGWCYPNGYVQADVSDDSVAGAGIAALYAAQRDGSKVGGTINVIGQNEQSVRWIVVAQGPPGAARLRATFPDGSADEMAPVDGVAVLVGRGSADLQKAKVTLTALDASGGTTATTTISALLEGRPYDPGCSAPQKLPAPGAHQPADAAAARQAVIDTFNGAYAKGVNDDAMFAYFDDSHGFAPIMANLRAGPYKEQTRTARIKLDDLVFLSPTVAAVQYEIDIPNYSIPSFAPRFNEVHLVDGQWKLARQGFCDDVGLGGVQCPP